MNAHSYTTTILADATPDRIFNAINDVRDWWSCCSNALGFFIQDSLRSLITTGKGQPMLKEDGLRTPRPY